MCFSVFRTRNRNTYAYDIFIEDISFDLKSYRDFKHKLWSIFCSINESYDKTIDRHFSLLLRQICRFVFK